MSENPSDPKSFFLKKGKISEKLFFPPFLGSQTRPDEEGMNENLSLRIWIGNFPSRSSMNENLDFGMFFENLDLWNPFRESLLPESSH